MVRRNRHERTEQVYQIKVDRLNWNIVFSKSHIGNKQNFHTDLKLYMSILENVSVIEV